MAGPRSVIVVAADAKEAVAEFQKLQASFKQTKDNASGLASVLSGVGAGLGIAGVLGVTNAVSTLKDVLGDSVRAYMEDERSIARLNVALKDNVTAWSGSTAALEESIASRTRLGFADEQLRQGMGTLVARTHDVGQAMSLLDRAMDLARYRGIDLSSAVDLIGKAFDGNVGALRRAGIAVKENATAQEALAAVLRSTRGQAEAYANTLEGKLVVASNRAEEASERLGQKLAPFVAGAADLASQGIDLLSLSLQGWSDLFDATYGQWARLYGGLDSVAVSAGLAHDALGNYTGEVDIAAAHMVGAASTAQQLAWSLNLVRINADPATASVKVNAAGSWTAATAMQALGAGLKGSSLGAKDFDNQIRKVTTGLGGASRAADDLNAKVRKQLSDAFETFRKNAVAALDAVHQKKLRAIQDAHDLRDAELEAAQAAVQAVVDAERAKVDAARDARRQAELEAAVAAAAAGGDPAALAAAQQALDDFLTDQRLEKMQAEADAQKDEIQKERDTNDQKAQDLTAAENERYATLKTALDNQLKLLQGKLDDGKKKWEVHLAAVIKILQNAGVDFAKEGENLGGVYADKLKEGLGDGIVEIARLMAKLLGITIDEKELAKFKAQLGIGVPKPKALGGSVFSGSPYLVGEQGPELFVPGSSGTIVPNGAIGGVGPLNLSVTVTGPAVFDPLGVAAQQIAEQIIPAINRERTRQGVF